MKKLIKLKDILAKVPVSRAHLYKMIAAGKFPPPTHLGGRGSFWLEETIDAWIDAQVAAPKKPIAVRILEEKAA